MRLITFFRGLLGRLYSFGNEVGGLEMTSKKRRGKSAPKPGSALPERSRLTPESSVELLQLARAGDEQALGRLLERYLPRLRRWASGRLPRKARDLRETQDLVQDTVLGVLPRLDSFEFRHDGALQAYFRQSVLNRIREEIRRTSRRDLMHSDIEHVDPSASPLEEAIGTETEEAYEAALGRLKPEEREAVIARIEMGQSYEEIATFLGKPSPDAARMTVSRALVRLAREMDRHA